MHVRSDRQLTRIVHVGELFDASLFAVLQMPRLAVARKSTMTENSPLQISGRFDLRLVGWVIVQSLADLAFADEPVAVDFVDVVEHPRRSWLYAACHRCSRPPAPVVTTSANAAVDFRHDQRLELPSIDYTHWLIIGFSCCYGSFPPLQWREVRPLAICHDWIVEIQWPLQVQYFFSFCSPLLKVVIMEEILDFYWWNSWRNTWIEEQNVFWYVCHRWFFL